MGFRSLSFGRRELYPSEYTLVYKYDDECLPRTYDSYDPGSVISTLNLVESNGGSIINFRFTISELDRDLAFTGWGSFAYLINLLHNRKIIKDEAVSSISHYIPESYRHILNFKSDCEPKSAKISI